MRAQRLSKKVLGALARTALTGAAFGAVVSVPACASPGVASLSSPPASLTVESVDGSLPDIGSVLEHRESGILPLNLSPPQRNSRDSAAILTEYGSPDHHRTTLCAATDKRRQVTFRLDYSLDVPQSPAASRPKGFDSVSEDGLSYQRNVVLDLPGLETPSV